MKKSYWAIRHRETGRIKPPYPSHRETAMPALYRGRGVAEHYRTTSLAKHDQDNWEVVEVMLTEVGHGA